MSASPQRSFLGNVLEQANHHRDDLSGIREAFAVLGPEMFEGKDHKLFLSLQELLDEDRAPTAAAVQLLKWPEFTSELARHYYEVAGELGEWKSYTDVVIQAYTTKLYLGRLTLALEAAKKGQINLVEDILTKALDEAPSRAAHSLSYVEDFSLPTHVPTLIPTPWPRLNKLLGGGFGVQGRNVLTLIVADTAVGKTTFALQLTNHFIDTGHHVLYFTGEFSLSDIITELARLRADLAVEELDVGRRKNIQRVLDQYQKAADSLASAPGRLAVVEDDFDGKLIRDYAERYRKKLRGMTETGEARPDAQLIVIVDNIDSAVEFQAGRHPREDSAYEYEAKRFESSAKRHEYQAIMLSQTNDEGRKRQGPPQKTDVAKAKVLVNRVGLMITLYRPTNDADREQLDRAGNQPGPRAKTWINTPKNRLGREDKIEFASNARTRKWFDPEVSAF